MTIKEIIEQLESLRENSADFAKCEDAEEIWKNDVIALDAAIAIIREYAAERNMK